MTNQPIL